MRVASVSIKAYSFTNIYATSDRSLKYDSPYAGLVVQNSSIWCLTEQLISNTAK